MVQKKSAFYLQIGFISLAVCSVGMTLANKFVMTTVKLPFLFLLWQNSATIILNYVGVHFGIWSINPYTQQQFVSWIVPAIIFCLMLGTSLQALPLVSVATVVVFRNLSTCLVALCEFMVLGNPAKKKQRYGTLVMVMGAVIYGWFDINFSVTGYFWLTINSCLYTVNAIYEKHTVVETTQTHVGTSTIQNILSLPVLLILVFITREDASAMGKLTLLQWFVVFLTGLLGCGISLSYMGLNKLTSATSISVAGNVNKALGIIMGSLLFATTFSYVQVLGLLVSMFGASVYSLGDKMFPKLFSEQHKLPLHREESSSESKGN